MVYCSLGFWDKGIFIPQSRQLHQQTFFSLGWKSKIKMLTELVSGKVPFPVCWHQPSLFVLTWWERQLQSLLLIRMLISSWWAPSWPYLSLIVFQRHHLEMSSRFNTYIIEGHNSLCNTINHISLVFGGKSRVDIFLKKTNTLIHSL